MEHKMEHFIFIFYTVYITVIEQIST